MNSFVKCFDAVSMVVEEATERFAPEWSINRERYSVLEEYCSAIDNISKEFDGTSYEVTVDADAMTVGIAIECDSLIIGTKNHRLYDLAQRSVSFGFSAMSNGNMQIKFVFPSVWKHAS